MLFIPDCWRTAQSLSSFPGADRSFRPTSQKTSLVFVTFWRPLSKLQNWLWNEAELLHSPEILNIKEHKRTYWIQCKHLVYFGLGCVYIDGIVKLLQLLNYRDVSLLSNMSLVSVQLSICTIVVERNALLSFFFQNESYLQIDILYKKALFPRFHHRLTMKRLNVVKMFKEYLKHVSSCLWFAGL